MVPASYSKLLLGGGVHVDLAGRVRGDVQLDRLADGDLDPLAVRGDRVAGERDVDVLAGRAESELERRPSRGCSSRRSLPPQPAASKRQETAAAWPGFGACWWILLVGARTGTSPDGARHLCQNPMSTSVPRDRPGARDEQRQARMSERLRPRDLAFLAARDRAAAHAQRDGRDLRPGRRRASTTTRLVALIADRIAFVPRYRQRLQPVPGRLANPVWVDDQHFDLAYHVRRSALPRPGTIDQLRELVARIISRPLDRHRPLWEMYFVEGLEDGRVALLSKSHQVLVDGVADRRPRPGPARRRPRSRGSSARDDWRPRRAGRRPALVLDAVRDSVRRRRGTALDTVRGAPTPCCAAPTARSRRVGTRRQRARRAGGPTPDVADQRRAVRSSAAS